MNLSKLKYGHIAVVFLLGLVGCTSARIPQSFALDPNVQPIAETTAPASAPDRQAIAASEEQIWSQLRQAEDTHYYVLMRHAIAPGTGDPDNFQLDDCSTQRNLSEEGREQARRTGEAFREQQVRVRQVLSSEWCRCLETAELLDLGSVERLPALNSFFQDRAKRPERTRQLREFMVANRDDAGVSVLVTHFVNIDAIAGSGVSSGGIVVMRVDDNNRPDVVGQIEPF